MIEKNEDKDYLLDSLERGFKFDSQILAFAYELQTYKEKYGSDQETQLLENQFMNTIIQGDTELLVENQIEYYLSLLEVKDTLCFEEKEKLEELYEGVHALLKMGVSCNPEILKLFQETRGQPFAIPSQ